MLAALRVLHVDPGRARRASPLSEDELWSQPSVDAQLVTASVRSRIRDPSVSSLNRPRSCLDPRSRSRRTTRPAVLIRAYESDHASCTDTLVTVRHQRPEAAP